MPNGTEQVKVRIYTKQTGLLNAALACTIENGPRVHTTISDSLAASKTTCVPVICARLFLISASRPTSTIWVTTCNDKNMISETTVCREQSTEHVLSRCIWPQAVKHCIEYSTHTSDKCNRRKSCTIVIQPLQERWVACGTAYNVLPLKVIRGQCVQEVWSNRWSSQMNSMQKKKIHARRMTLLKITELGHA